MYYVSFSQINSLVAHGFGGTKFVYWNDAVRGNLRDFFWPINPNDTGSGKFSYLHQGDAHGKIKDVTHLKGSYYSQYTYSLDGRYEPFCEKVVTYLWYKIYISARANGQVCSISYYVENQNTLATDYTADIVLTLDHLNGSYADLQLYGCTLGNTDPEKDGPHTSRARIKCKTGSVNAEKRVIAPDVLIGRALENSPTDRGAEYQCYVDAVESIQCNVNMLENIGDILSLGTGIAKNCGDILDIFTKIDARRFAMVAEQRRLRCLDDLTQYFADWVGMSRRCGVKDVTVGEFMKNVPSQLWLQYRYAFNTTLSDIAEIKRYMNSCNVNPKNILDASKILHTVRSGCTYGDCSYHLSFSIKRKSYRTKSYTAAVLAQQCNDFTANLRRYGFYPSAKNLWDCIPLSFVIDWMIPIGDYLEQEDALWLQDYYSIHDSCVSHKYTVNDKDLQYTYYVRYAQAPPSFCYEHRNPSTKTSIMRVIDGVSLLM